jgi:hydroxyethylthiazole kinase-like uncharacterized protein yjeF
MTTAVSTRLLTTHAVSTVPKVSLSSVSFLDATTARRIDEELMKQPGFSIDQLMELAGLSVATACMDITQWDSSTRNNILIVCGPGNNGGDGLVAARHLKHFGLHPSVVYPKENHDPLFINLIQQCTDLDIPISSKLPDSLTGYSLIIDALFGFSFKGPTRDPFTGIIHALSTLQQTHASTLILSVDLPSGWDVEKGDIFSTKFHPSAVISLTLPKLCLSSYTGIHYIGGR